MVVFKFQISMQGVWVRSSNFIKVQQSRTVKSRVALVRPRAARALRQAHPSLTELYTAVRVTVA